MKLEDITTGQRLSGVEPAQVVSVVATVRLAEGAIQLIYRTPDGAMKECQLARADEASISLASAARPFSFDGNGADFQLFLSLLDSDRFYGKFRDGVHKVDAADLMRRMVKEEILTFDGTPLFPERRAYTVNYTLSKIESALYESVTQYVQTEMGKADQLKGSRKGSVGFALTALQRRLASSPEAIFQSLKRRRERLESRLREEKLGIRGRDALAETLAAVPDDDDDLDAQEQEGLEEALIDDATAAATVAELDAEIAILRGLEAQARIVVASAQDRKWDELSRILQNNPEVRILVATDAAGEGVNLQNANLMVNYDLPWNPNRLEQRFGRIHRIGQTQVCHLWNLVAKETREGDVYHRLLKKIEVESQALAGRVFDILGEVFEETSLKDLLLEAIRYGDRPDVRARLTKKIDQALDHDHLRALLDRNALVQESMTPERLFAVKEEMEKAEARRLQPYFVKAFFVKALDALGGTAHPREVGRFEITHEIRSGDGAVLSKRLQFARVAPDGAATFAGWAPHLDLEPLSESERPLLAAVLTAPWIASGQEAHTLGLAAETLVPEHYNEVAHRRIAQVDKTLAAVHERLSGEIAFWQDRWLKLKEDGEAGLDVRLNLENVCRTIADLEGRLEGRKKALQAMRHVVKGTPVVLGAALIVPAGLMRSLRGEASSDPAAAAFGVDPAARARIERLAMDAVRQAEEARGHRVVDCSPAKCGWDLTSYPPAVDGKQPNPLHIEVKGRVKGANTITVTRNEMRYAFNQGDKFVLAIAIVDENDMIDGPYYVRSPFDREPGWGLASVNYDVGDLLARANRR